LNSFSCLCRNETPQVQKKSKKSAVKNLSTLDLNDQAALNRRAQRFQRDQEIERQKNGSVGINGGQASLKANYRNTHLFNRISRSNSPPSDMNVDEPEADPVRMPCCILLAAFTNVTVIECAELGSLYDCRNEPADIQRLPAVNFCKLVFAPLYHDFSFFL
jgi:hypothetical protein